MADLKILIFNIIFVSIFFPLLLVGQSEMRVVRNDAFQPGEYLKYRVYYDSWMTSWMTAGYGTMTVTESEKVFDGRETYRLEVIGKSAGLFNLFFKVDDRFVSYVDKDAFLPREFYRQTREGSFSMDESIIYDYEKNTAKSERKETSIPEGVLDVVSSFYYMRTFEFDTAEAGDEYYINFIMDDSIYRSRVIFLGRENVETEMGVFPCLKLKPQIAMGNTFQDPYPMVLWVTDDRNKIPILGRSGVYVGSVTMELVEHRGLLHPLLPLTD